jgi:hypothetical protein
MTIMGTSDADIDVDVACRHVCGVRPSQGEDDALVDGAAFQLAVSLGGPRSWSWAWLLRQMM